MTKHNATLMETNIVNTQATQVRFYDQSC